MIKWSNMIKVNASLRGIGDVMIWVFPSCKHKLNKYGRVIDIRDVYDVIKMAEDIVFTTPEMAAEWISSEIRAIRTIRVKTRIETEEFSTECEVS